MIETPVFLAMITALTGAFGWLAIQIKDLKKEGQDLRIEVATANRMHRECEHARYQDGLKMQRFELALQALGQTTNTADTINETLNPTHPEDVVDQAIRETIVLSEGVPPADDAKL